MSNLHTIFLRNILFCLAMLFSNVLSATEKQVVMGAGPSTAVVTLFFEHFSQTSAASGYTFVVDQRSIKHAGGIQASDKYLFGRTGRPLSLAEKQSAKGEIHIARIPITMAVGSGTGVTKISLDQLEQILAGKITNWKQLGGTDHKIILVGREDTEAAFGVLKAKYVFFSGANFEKILTRDHQVSNFINSTNGNYAISFGAASNFANHHHLKVDGFDAGISLGLVYDLANSSHPLVSSAQAFAKSNEWLAIVKKNGFLPPDSN